MQIFDLISNDISILEYCLMPLVMVLWFHSLIQEPQAGYQY